MGPSHAAFVIPQGNVTILTIASAATRGAPAAIRASPACPCEADLALERRAVASSAA